jgi:hypothetical protein
VILYGKEFNWFGTKRCNRPHQILSVALIGGSGVPRTKFRYVILKMFIIRILSMYYDAITQECN